MRRRPELLTDTELTWMMAIAWFFGLVIAYFAGGRWQVAKYMTGTVGVVGLILGFLYSAWGQARGLFLLALFGIACVLMFKIDRWEERSVKRKRP
jgi:hypothetical protein